MLLRLEWAVVEGGEKVGRRHRAMNWNRVAESNSMCSTLADVGN
jgi:hypothetical protein